MGSVEFALRQLEFLGYAFYHLVRDLVRPRWTVSKTFAICVVAVPYLWSLEHEMSKLDPTYCNMLVRIGVCAVWAETGMLAALCAWRLCVRLSIKYDLFMVLCGGGGPPF